jgi:SAM-dependent methyltransferase
MTLTGQTINPVRTRSWINAGAGTRTNTRYPRLFHDWQEIRVDINPGTEPDIVADITDLSGVPSNAVDAIWSSHCLEHLFQYQVPRALSEFRRVIRDDGFVVFLVPDLQSVASLVAADKFHEPVYHAPIGPVTPHDMFYGYGPAIAQGYTSMAHRCGFTPTILVNMMNEVGFPEFIIQRRPNLELAVVARKTHGDDATNCKAVIQALEL